MSKLASVVFSSLILSTFITGCNANISSQINPNQKVLQDIADQYLTQLSPYEITALPITVQCGDQSQTTALAGTMGNGEQYPPIQSNSIYQIGSITKSFASVVLLQLEDNPKNNFSINDTMGKWFPEYPQWSSVTIRELMNMTSGIPSYTMDYYNSNVGNYTTYISPENLIGYVANQPLLFKPGSQWNYSNTNYVLLGLLIRKITGNSPDIEITNRIIDKLHLTNTHFVLDVPQYVVPVDQLVHGYFNQQSIPIVPMGTDTTFWSLSEAYTAGAIISTPQDISTYVYSLYNPGVLLTPKQLALLTSLVSQKTGQPIAAPTANDPSAFGLGIMAMYLPNYGVIYTYGGDEPGFLFEYFYNPTNKAIMSYAINSVSDQDQSIENNLGYTLLAYSTQLCK